MSVKLMKFVCCVVVLFLSLWTWVNKKIDLKSRDLTLPIQLLGMVLRGTSLYMVPITHSGLFFHNSTNITNVCDLRIVLSHWEQAFFRQTHISAPQTALHRLGLTFILLTSRVSSGMAAWQLLWSNTQTILCPSSFGDLASAIFEVSEVGYHLLQCPVSLFCYGTVSVAAGSGSIAVKWVQLFNYNPIQ